MHPVVAFLFVLLTSSVLAGADGSTELIPHDINIELYPTAHRIKAVDRMTNVPAGDSIRFFINRDVRVESVWVNGLEKPFEESILQSAGDSLSEPDGRRDEKNERTRLMTIPRTWEGDKVDLDVFYSGTIFDSLKAPDETTGLIEERGAFLSGESFWYPSIPGSMSNFKLTVTTPDGYESVSQGIRVSREEAGGKIVTVWEASCPGEAIFLVAGKWEVTTLHHRGMDIYAFFFPESGDLVKDYLEATAGYIDLYEEMIGPYPYGKFAIVENFFPTGYGLPSFTLFGSSVIRLPFIVRTSLGHEVLHNWWGNGVFVDYEKGNWCEGLTTCLADQFYKERESAADGLRYRKNLLRDYTVYVGQGRGLPVRSFKSRTTPATRSIGYGKVAMIFHQLKIYLGEARFMRALRLFYQRFIFRKASWEDLKSSFVEIAGEDLDWFFTQWVDGEGAPIISLEKVTSKKEDGSNVVTFRLGQSIVGDDYYRLLVPIVLETTAGDVEEFIVLDDLSASFSVTTENQPVRLLIDQDYNVFRRLAPMEIEPVLSLVLGDRNTLFVVPEAEPGDDGNAFREVARLIRSSCMNIMVSHSIYGG